MRFLKRRGYGFYIYTAKTTCIGGVSIKIMTSSIKSISFSRKFNLKSYNVKEKNIFTRMKEREKKAPKGWKSGKKGFCMNIIQLPPARAITGEPLLFWNSLNRIKRKRFPPAYILSSYYLRGRKWDITPPWFLQGLDRAPFICWHILLQDVSQAQHAQDKHQKRRIHPTG